MTTTLRPPGAHPVNWRRDEDLVQAPVHPFITFAGGNVNTFCAKTLVAFCAAMTLAPAAIAGGAHGKVLGAEAAKSLVSGRMWQAPIIGGPGHYYWSWKSDGSVCLRQNETTGKCLDTGTWKLKGNRLCYELTWYGGGLGLKSRCLRIVDEGNGRYGELEESGIATLKFSVVE